MKKKNMIAVAIALIVFTVLNGIMLFYNDRLITNEKANQSYLVLEDESSQNKKTICRSGISKIEKQTGS